MLRTFVFLFDDLKIGIIRSLVVNIMRDKSESDNTGPSIKIKYS